MERKLALHNGTIYSGNDTIQDQALLISGDKIIGIVPVEDISDEFEKVDVEGCHICPGLIDLQIYGAGGNLFSETLSADALDYIEKTLLKQGCTSFYLTLATNTIPIFDKAIRVFKAASPRIALGLHLEGPFLNPKKRGAHPAELIFKADLPTLRHLFEDNEDVIGIITVAPELLAQECLDYLLSKGVLISAGHTDATFEEASRAFDKGIKAATHLWNAMSPLHHRQAGVPGAIFNHKNVCASIVVDGIHVDYEVVKISKAQLGERLFLITDAVTSCNSGIYQHVRNDDHYVLPDGTLSGSALTLLGAIRNCVENAGIPLDEAIRMTTIYPARLIEREDIGRLEKGSRANVLVFDNGFNVKRVYFEGEKVD
ncbi:N-acetylglucosamine-6-phosphate deacetylase [Sphingobacterium faecale]|uniref:N-acetylglucosamine-6-phosphate deacetylase n=1 Tax=Sphingobacterium faecale TaxID=2803775 RepID=A0ABS1R6B6_9SPHI|nr:N-acetylglucosamine-6-phosphate deacetylase [Sphingobacterium faecale]MBL1410218.1 N-acetylglucosamine-6-phosphate deacetylase [Sphingobacterium faecale]